MYPDRVCENGCRIKIHPSLLHNSSNLFSNKTQMNFILELFEQTQVNFPIEFNRVYNIPINTPVNRRKGDSEHEHVN